VFNGTLRTVGEDLDEPEPDRRGLMKAIPYDPSAKLPIPDIKDTKDIKDVKMKVDPGKSLLIGTAVGPLAYIVIDLNVIAGLSAVYGEDQMRTILDWLKNKLDMYNRCISTNQMTYDQALTQLVYALMKELGITAGDLYKKLSLQHEIALNRITKMEQSLLDFRATETGWDAQKEHLALQITHMELMVKKLENDKKELAALVEARERTLAKESQSEISQRDDKIRRLRARIADQQARHAQDTQAIRSQYDSLNVKLEDTERSSRDDKGTVAFTRSRLDDALVEIETLTQKLQEATDELAEKSGEMVLQGQRSDAAVSDLQGVIRELRQTLADKQAEALNLEAINRQQYGDLQNLYNDLRNTLQLEQQQAVSDRQAIQQLQVSIAGGLADLALSQSENGSLKNQINQHLQDLQVQQQQLAQAQQRIRDLTVASSSSSAADAAKITDLIRQLNDSVAANKQALQQIQNTDALRIQAQAEVTAQKQLADQLKTRLDKEIERLKKQLDDERAISAAELKRLTAELSIVNRDLADCEAQVQRHINDNNNLRHQLSLAPSAATNAALIQGMLTAAQAEVLRLTTKLAADTANYQTHMRAAGNAMRTNAANLNQRIARLRAQKRAWKARAAQLTQIGAVQQTLHQSVHRFIFFYLLIVLWLPLLMFIFHFLAIHQDRPNSP